MNYLSTRGDATPRRFCEILLEGGAPDGGLYLPERYPQVDAATLAPNRPPDELTARMADADGIPLTK